LYIIYFIHLSETEDVRSVNTVLLYDADAPSSGNPMNNSTFIARNYNLVGYILPLTVCVYV